METRPAPAYRKALNPGGKALRQANLRGVAHPCASIPPRNAPTGSQAPSFSRFSGLSGSGSRIGETCPVSVSRKANPSRSPTSSRSPSRANGHASDRLADIPGSRDLGGGIGFVHETRKDVDPVQTSACLIENDSFARLGLNAGKPVGVSSSALNACKNRR